MKIRFHTAVKPTREVGATLSRPSCLSDTGANRRFEAWPRRAQRSTVVVHAELGVGYAVFIRGEGGPLSWDSGRILTCAELGTWVWMTNSPTDKFQFQLLLNDEVWERGQPHVLEGGHILHVAPDFEWPEIPKTSPRLC